MPWHPFLVLLVPIATMYAAFPGSVILGELWRSALAALVVAACLVALAGLLYRDVRKGALLVSLVCVVVLSFDAAYRLIEPLHIGTFRPGRRMFVLPATYLLLAWTAWRIARIRRHLHRATVLLNVVAAGCLILPVATLVQSQVRMARDRTPRLPPPIAADSPTEKPDIYYLVFDRYGDERTMRQYGLDNAPFYRYLDEKGFYLARESRSNYIKTVLSLASSFNMSYLDPLQEAQGQASENWLPVYDWIRNGRVMAFLRTQGYRHVHVGSWYWPTVANPAADRNVNYYTTVPYAAMRLLDSALINPLRSLLPTPLLDARRQQWFRVRREIDEVIAHAGDPGPRFVFMHVLVPHSPYVFDKDGSYVSLDQEAHRSLARNYTNQVQAANSMIRRLVDGILAGAQSPPVILLQGDEGPYPAGTGSGDHYDWHTATSEQLQEKSGILNAYYLPGDTPPPLYPSISPVNSFRVVLNRYFRTRLPLLSDRVYGHDSEYHPYTFFDITREVASPIARLP